MRTMYFIVIENTNDALPQLDWASFYGSVDKLIEMNASLVCFGGMSMGDAPWQNAAWGFECNDKIVATKIKRSIVSLRLRYNQSSITWLEGKATLI